MVSVKGVAPGLMLLPAREYEWELINRVEIRIPVEGLISEHIKPEESAKGIKIGGEDAFLLYDEEYFYFWDIVRVLFATQKYPQLADDQCFNVLALRKDGQEVVLFGEIVKIVT